MPHILQNLYTLKQYFKFLEPHDESNKDIPIPCSLCQGKHIVKNGHYFRQSDRHNTGEKNLNPVPIQRYFCHHCRATFSVLPTCIPPRRWYLWDTQEAVLKSQLNQHSIQQTHIDHGVSRSTVHRWMARFKASWLAYADHFRQCWDELASACSFVHFWEVSFKHSNLADIMRSLHCAGLVIP